MGGTEKLRCRALDATPLRIFHESVQRAFIYRRARCDSWQPREYARSDVHFSIGVQGPGVFVQPAPVNVQPGMVKHTVESGWGNSSSGTLMFI